VIAAFARSVIRCPASRRALLLLVLLAGGALPGCSFYAADVHGLPAHEAWAALPLREWLNDGRGEPEAIAVCSPPECGPPLAVGVMRLTGVDAATAEALLRNPEPLARALRDRAAGKRPVLTEVAVKPLQDSPYQGFTIRLGRRDNARHPAFGAALGRRAGADLHIVLVIGEDAATVEMTARNVAAEHL
jgi:hypothetical protein